jgi:methylated-DNA-[protein]-cysteine S-methyltransferase
VAKNSLLSLVGAEATGESVNLLDQELKAYFTGKLTTFTTVVDWNGYTPFRTSILRYTAAIPYGEVRTYGEAALAVGSPQAARAAGGALHNNRTPVIIPCHRVLGANGNLVGFGGGLDMKSALLKLEKQQG